MKKTHLIIYIFIALLCACSKTTVNTVTNNENTLEKPSIISSTPTRRISKPTMFSPTDSLIFLPSISPTMTPTYPMFPTLQPKDALVKLKDLYKNNGGCQLPCWWGINPSNTSWSEVNQLLGPLGYFEIHNYLRAFSTFVPRSMDPIKGPLPYGYNYGNIDPSFYIVNERVKAIIISSRWVKKDFDYSLAGLLNYFGKPDEIWMETDTSTNGDLPPSYILDLVYAHKGMIETRGKGKINNDNFVFCPQNITNFDGFPPYLYLWSKDENVEFTDSEILNAFNPRYSQYFDKLSNYLSEINTIENFYITYSDPKTKICMSIDASS
jgi:hypothetical protein